ncbi:hypothetical protein C7S20_06065 [Christiangramia fulva]|uniref:Uncharacterized protein n=2 Tax=Christiangramia fulva TaxID=2126553 RepID=A0A2R3Z3M6_9FLAO|nr:hypothetical protein C7S20_06065 [Christiangramia fulva]
MTKIVKLGFALALVLGFAYLLEIYFASGDEQVRKLINFSYLYNFGFSALLLSNYIIFKKQLIEFIGFIFLAAGVIRIGLFYFLLQQGDFGDFKENFFLFFVPFILCLGVEILFLARELNRANFNNNN